MGSDKYVICFFCEKDDLLSLVKKTFNDKEYEMRCHSVISDEMFTSNPQCDCIILDKEIDDHLMANIRKKFGNIPVVYLPSLDNKKENGFNITYISEPLKLSELKKTVDRLLLKMKRNK